MFCQNCGKNLEQGEMFCSACGTRAEVQPAQPVEPTYTAPAEPVYTAPIEPTYTAPTPVEPAYAAPVAPAPTKGGNKKLFIILGIIGGGVLVLAIAAYFIIGALLDTPENVAEDYLTALCNLDAEGVVDAMPAYALNEFADEYNLPANRELVIAAMQADAVRQTPKSLQIIDVYQTYDFTYADFLKENDDYVDDMGGSKADVLLVSDACKVVILANINGQTTNVETYCVKYDGDWCVVRVEMSESVDSSYIEEVEEYIEYEYEY